MRKVTVEKENKIEEYLKLGYHAKTIAKKCKVKEATIKTIRNEKQIEEKDYDKRNRTVEFLYLSGMTDKEISNYLGVTKEDVNSILIAEGRKCDAIKYTEVHNADNAYIDLANEIILFAIKDYKLSKKAWEKNKENYEAEDRIREVRNFFGSSWFSELCELDPDYLLRKIDEGEEEKRRKKQKQH